MIDASPSGFRFGLGHPALEFVATLGNRPGTPIERLCSTHDLSRWLAEAELVQSSRPSATGLTDARRLREALARVLDSALEQTRAPIADIAFLNGWARRPVAAPQIQRNKREGTLTRKVVGPDAVTAALAQLARLGVELVTGPELARVRTCGGCSLRFMDRSRPGKRRWCSMETCGNRSKTARYREKSHHVAP